MKYSKSLIFIISYIFGISLFLSLIIFRGLIMLNWIPLMIFIAYNLILIFIVLISKKKTYYPKLQFYFAISYICITLLVFNFADYIYDRQETKRIEPVLSYMQANDISLYENNSGRDQCYTIIVSNIKYFNEGCEGEIKDKSALKHFEYINKEIPDYFYKIEKSNNSNGYKASVNEHIRTRHYFYLENKDNCKNSGWNCENLRKVERSWYVQIS